MDCENCAYFAYDEEYEDYYCTAVLDASLKIKNVRIFEMVMNIKLSESRIKSKV